MLSSSLRDIGTSRVVVGANDTGHDLWDSGIYQVLSASRLLLEHGRGHSSV